MTSSRYIPYVLATAALLAGVFGQPPVTILVLAVLAVIVVAPDRLRQARAQSQRTGPPNAVVEGAYLLVLQTLILGAAYGLGYFLAFRVQV